MAKIDWQFANRLSRVSWALS